MELENIISELVSMNIRLANNFKTEEGKELRSDLFDITQRLERYKQDQALQLLQTDVIPCYFIIRTTFRDEEREYSFPNEEIFNEALQRMTEDAEFTDIVWLTGNKA